MYELLYPERRSVTPETILTWASDAVANGEIDQAWDEGNARQAAAALHEAGIITLRAS
jgi:hypothetical protein